MKLRKLKLLAMALSLFAACGGMLSAMETQKSEENSKVNSKSGQNKNKTQNNKPQSKGKSNKNIGVQIPYYAYPVGYLGLNEVGDLFGFDYLLFGRYGIIKGAKHLFFGESNKNVEDKANEVNNEIKNKVKNKVNNEIKNKANNEIKNKANDEIKNNEVEKGPYWQYNYDMIMRKETVNSYHANHDEFKKTMERIMNWPNEKILLGQPKVKLYGDHKDSKNDATGFSYEEFLKNLRGNRKMKRCDRYASNSFCFAFEGNDDGQSFESFELAFFSNGWSHSSKTSIALTKRKVYKPMLQTSSVEMRFDVPPELYS